MRPSTTNTQPACLVPGQTPNPSLVDVFWTASDPRFIDGYLLYRYVNGSAQAEAPLYLGPSQTSFHDTNVQPGSTYNYAVLAFKNYGTSGMTYTWANNTPQSPPTVDASAGFIQVPATPPSCNPPTITSLNITQGSPPVASYNGAPFSGASRTSGLLSGESGSNWRNSIFVTLNATPTSPSTTPIKEYYLTFQGGPQLAYTASAGSITGCSGNYCVNEGNIWKNILAAGRSIPENCTIGINCQYSVLQRSGPSWEVFFYKPFGDKNMSILGYVKDENGLCSNNNCDYANLNALQQP